MNDTNFNISVLQYADELFRLYPDGRVSKNPNVSWDECAVALFDALEREGTRRSVKDLQEENIKLHAAITRVRALHLPGTLTFTGEMTGEVWKVCNHCRDDNGFAVEHPCLTLRILDGEDV
jgi:hypothetical protein